MDKAIEEVFDKVTKHHDDNRHNVEGWKTNSHYLLTEKFIIPHMAAADKWNRGNRIDNAYGHYFELVEDMAKAICFITGDNYDNFPSLSETIRSKYKCYVNGKFVEAYYDHSQARVDSLRKECYKEGKQFEVEISEPVYGELFDWGFFTVRAFKKGTMHFKFKDKEVWGKFNQRVAKIKGYPLFEATNKQKAENKAANTSSAPKTNFREPTVLATFKVA
jgi:hypothetical protein